jgi:hypothetical protein
MELEEMKFLWGEMSREMENQKKLTGTLIMKMIRINYRNKINKILIPESIGAMACLAAILYIAAGMHNLNTWYLQVCGFLSVIILFFLPLLSLKATHRIRSVKVSENNYAQSLAEYAKAKMKFLYVQKFSLYLCALLLVVVLPVMGALVGGKDLFMTKSLWFSYALMFPSFYTFFRWVFKSYVKTTAEAENILKELEE